MDGKFSLHHTHYNPHSPAAALGRAPVTERLTFYFSGDLSESDMKSWDENMKKFVKVLEENAGDDYKGSATGWVVEELDHEGVEGKAKAVTGAIGWASVEAHIAFRKTAAFKESIGALRDGVKGREMHHVKFQEA